MKLFISWVEAMHCDDTTEEVNKLGKPRIMTVITEPNLTQYSHLEGQQGYRGSRSKEVETGCD